MMKRFFSLFLIFFVIVFNFPVSSFYARNLDAKDILDAEEYKVYSDIINNDYKPSKAAYKPNLIVFQEYTGLHLTDSSSDIIKQVKHEVPSVSKELLNNFKSKNEKSHKLYRFFKINVPYMLISKKDFKLKYNNSAWKDFYKKYPKPWHFTIVSRVGFNKKKTQALVYIESTFGGWDGAGQCLLLVKNKDKWVVTHRALIWIA